MSSRVLGNVRTLGRMWMLSAVLACAHAVAADACYVHFNKGIEAGVTDAWRTVTLDHTYNSMVVICTPQYDDNEDPVVVRVRNAVGNQFDMRVQNPGGSAAAPVDVTYAVFEEGVYDEDLFGVRLEAQKHTSTVTDHKSSWVGEPMVYWNLYENPVVLGQVMTSNDPDWSTFWCYRGANQHKHPPNRQMFSIGKHVGEDSDTTRADETIGYVVIEGGNGVMDGVRFWAKLGSDKIAGMGSNPPYDYDTGAGPNVGGAVAVQSAMESNNGGWAVLYSPVTGSTLDLAIDEDQIGDSERSHGKEPASYLVFGSEPPVRPTLVGFTSSASTEVEGNVVIELEVKLNNESAGTVTVDYAVTGGSATPGEDFSLPAGTLTFLPGETSQVVSVQFLDDEDKEVDETIDIELSNPGNAGLCRDVHILTMVDDGDGLFNIKQVWYNEDEDGVSMRIDQQGTDEYDLLFVDAPSFSDSLSNQWQLAVRDASKVLTDTGGTNRVAPSALLPGMMRFYRLSSPGRWEGTSNRRASAEVYCYCPVQLYTGQNWVSLWGIPDVNRLGLILGHNLPSGTTPNTATRISWYERTADQLAYQEVWLSKQGNNTIWRYSVKNGSPNNAKAEGVALPLEEGFIVELPQGTAVLPLVFAIPRVTQPPQEIKANFAYNLVSLAGPRLTHPSELNLVESGFQGSFFPVFSDAMWKFSGAGQVVPDVMWYNTMDNTWRLMSAGFPVVPWNYMRPGESFVIHTRGSTVDWTWTSPLNYTPPTKFMTP